MTKGLLLVLSAPSGAGKSTLCREVVQRRPDTWVSISCTTRSPRQGENNGRDYNFMTPADFERRLAAGEFIESARVHDHLYGTLKKPVEDALSAGRDVILNIDTQGAHSVKKHFPDCVRLFLLPPSWEVLEERLRKRGQDAPEVIAKRLANARHEIRELPAFDYAVVNENLEEAVHQTLSILTAERRRLARTGDELRKLKFLS